MHAQRKDRRGEATPVIIMVIAAVMATAGILLNDVSSGNGPQGSGNARMITAAALSRAGAIEIPSEPSVGQSAS
jgi:hypothetical protein